MSELRFGLYGVIEDSSYRESTDDSLESSDQRPVVQRSSHQTARKMQSRTYKHRDKLHEWMQKRDRKKAIQKKCEKPIFKVGIVHHRLYSPPLPPLVRKKSVKHLSFAPTNYKFKPPEGVQKFPLSYNPIEKNVSPGSSLFIKKQPYHFRFSSPRWVELEKSPLSRIRTRPSKKSYHVSSLRYVDEESDDVDVLDDSRERLCVPTSNLHATTSTDHGSTFDDDVFLDSTQETCTSLLDSSDIIHIGNINSCKTNIPKPINSPDLISFNDAQNQLLYEASDQVKSEIKKDDKCVENELGSKSECRISINQDSKTICKTANTTDIEVVKLIDIGSDEESSSNIRKNDDSTVVPSLKPSSEVPEDNTLSTTNKHPRDKTYIWSKFPDTHKNVDTKNHKKTKMYMVDDRFSDYFHPNQSLPLSASEHFNNTSKEKVIGRAKSKSTTSSREKTNIAGKSDVGSNERCKISKPDEHVGNTEKEIESIANSNLVSDLEDQSIFETGVSNRLSETSLNTRARNSDRNSSSKKEDSRSSTTISSIKNLFSRESLPRSDLSSEAESIIESDVSSRLSDIGLNSNAIFSENDTDNKQDVSISTPCIKNLFSTELGDQSIAESDVSSRFSETKYNDLSIPSNLFSTDFPSTSVSSTELDDQSIVDSDVSKRLSDIRMKKIPTSTPSLNKVPHRDSLSQSVLSTVPNDESGVELDTSSRLSNVELNNNARFSETENKNDVSVPSIKNLFSRDSLSQSVLSTDLNDKSFAEADISESFSDIGLNQIDVSMSTPSIKNLFARDSLSQSVLSTGNEDQSLVELEMSSRLCNSGLSTPSIKNLFSRDSLSQTALPTEPEDQSVLSMDHQDRSIVELDVSSRSSNAGLNRRFGEIENKKDLPRSSIKNQFSRDSLSQSISTIDLDDQSYADSDVSNRFSDIGLDKIDKSMSTPSIKNLFSRDYTSDTVLLTDYEDQSIIESDISSRLSNSRSNNEDQSIDETDISMKLFDIGRNKMDLSISTPSKKPRSSIKNQFSRDSLPQSTLTIDRDDQSYAASDVSNRFSDIGLNKIDVSMSTPSIKNLFSRDYISDSVLLTDYEDQSIIESDISSRLSNIGSNNEDQFIDENDISIKLFDIGRNKIDVSIYSPSIKNLFSSDSLSQSVLSRDLDDKSIVESDISSRLSFTGLNNDLRFRETEDPNDLSVLSIKNLFSRDSFSQSILSTDVESDVSNRFSDNGLNKIDVSISTPSIKNLFCRDSLSLSDVSTSGQETRISDISDISKQFCKINLSETEDDDDRTIPLIKISNSSLADEGEFSRVSKPRVNVVHSPRNKIKREPEIKKELKIKKSTEIGEEPKLDMEPSSPKQDPSLLMQLRSGKILTPSPKATRKKHKKIKSASSAPKTQTAKEIHY